MAPDGLLKIGELARRTGVNRGTIQHYLREGLLPRPVKTHKNMAYYDEACVDRIKLIKELQKQRFLPLTVIKRMVSTRDAGAQVKAAVEAQQEAMSTVAIETQARPLTLAEAAKTFELPRRLIQDVERVGLVSQQVHDGKKVFFGPDLEVLAAIAQLKKLGFTERAGFKPEDLLIYKKTLETLIDQELETFLRVVTGKKSPEKAAELARNAANGATALLVALRKRLIVQMLAAAGTGTVSRLLTGAPEEA